MTEIIDQIKEEMLQAPPPKYSRAETLALLMQIFAPVGPSETLLVEDLATVRTQIQQADSRRDSLIFIQQHDAAKRYELQSARESADLETLWRSDPGHFHQLMRQDVVFLSKHVRLWRSLVSVCEDPAAAPTARLVAGILQANAQPKPGEELDAETRELVRFAVALQKNPENFARNLQSALGTELPFAEIARQLPDATLARQKLHAVSQKNLQQSEASLAKAARREAIALSHYSNCQHAGENQLESLKLIGTDIRQLQIRHDKTLRTLNSLQYQRKRQAERDAERLADKARREAERAADKARKAAEPLANPPGSTSQPKPANTFHKQSINDTSIQANIDSIITTPPETDASNMPVDAKTIEAELSSGNLTLPKPEQICLMFSHWADRELFDHSRRFRNTFRHFREGYLLNRIKEIAAQEREARHDRLKITEEHQPA